VRGEDRKAQRDEDVPAARDELRAGKSEQQVRKKRDVVPCGALKRRKSASLRKGDLKKGRGIRRVRKKIRDWLRTGGKRQIQDKLTITETDAEKLEGDGLDLV